MRSEIPGVQGLLFITAASVGTAAIMVAFGEWLPAVACVAGVVVGWRFVLALSRK